MASLHQGHKSIPNFGNTADVGTVGYIVACKTRNCNAAFYRWYGTTIVEPFVQKCRTINECKNLDGTPERAFVTCDGEASQISVFQEEQMLALFVEALIDFGKSPASCSATCQSSDASVFFKALKAKLKSVSKEMAANGALEKRLKDFIEKKLINADGSPHFSSERKTQTVGSLLIFSYTVKETLRGELIRDGYREIGQYPLNFRKTMGKCTRQLSTREMEVMEREFPVAVQKFRNKGCITEAEYDEMGIVSVNDLARNQKPKDQRPLQNQRSVIMNMEDCISKYRNYRAEVAARPIRIAREREERRQRKLEKDEAARLNREARETEKRRRASLTDEERKAELKAKRKATRDRKREEVAAAAAAAIAHDAPDVQNDQHSIHDSDYELSDLDDGPGENFDDDPGHGIVDLDRRIANEESDVNDD